MLDTWKQKSVGTREGKIVQRHGKMLKLLPLTAPRDKARYSRFSGNGGRNVCCLQKQWLTEDKKQRLMKS